MYRVLPVQIAYQAWSEKHVEYAELRQVSVALNTETINQRRYIVSKQSEIDQLKAEKVGLENLLSLQRHKAKALEVELANSRDYSDRLHEKIHDVELQIAVHWGADEDTDSVLRDVEKALRGES